MLSAPAPWSFFFALAMVVQMVIHRKGDGQDWRGSNQLIPSLNAVVAAGLQA